MTVQQEHNGGDNNPARESTGEDGAKKIIPVHHETFVRSAEVAGSIIFVGLATYADKAGSVFCFHLFLALSIICGLLVIASHFKKAGFRHSNRFLAAGIASVFIIFSLLPTPPENDTSGNKRVPTPSVETKSESGHETDEFQKHLKSAVDANQVALNNSKIMQEGIEHSGKHLDKLKENLESMEADALAVLALLRAGELNEFNSDDIRAQDDAADSEITPMHIFSTFKNQANSLDRSTDNLYKRVPVTWTLYFHSMSVDPEGHCAIDFDVIDMTNRKGKYPWVIVSTNLEGNELLRSAKRGEKYQVSGSILLTHSQFICLKGTSIKPL